MYFFSVVIEMKNHALFEPRVVDTIISYHRTISLYQRNVMMLLNQLNMTTVFNNDFNIRLENAENTYHIIDILRATFLQMYFPHVQAELHIRSDSYMLIVSVRDLTDNKFIRFQITNVLFNIEYVRPMYCRSSDDFLELYYNLRTDENEEDFIYIKILCSMVSLFLPFDSIFLHEDNDIRILSSAVFLFDTKWILYLYNKLYHLHIPIDCYVENDMVIVSLFYNTLNQMTFVISDFRETY